MASKESHLPVGVESHCDERSIKIVGLERNPAFKLRPLACKNPPLIPAFSRQGRRSFSADGFRAPHSTTLEYSLFLP